MPKRSYSAQNAHVIGVHVPPRALIAEFVATEGLSKQWIEPLHQTIVHMVEAIRVFAKPSPAARQQRLKQMGTVLKATKSLADIVTQEPAATSLNDLFSRELGSSLSTQAFERTGLVVTDRLSPHTLGGRAAQGRNGPYAALEDEAMQLRILYARKLGANVLEEVLRNLTGPVEAYLALERQSKGGRPADNHRRSRHFTSRADLSDPLWQRAPADSDGPLRSALRIRLEVSGDLTGGSGGCRPARTEGARQELCITTPATGGGIAVR